MQRRDTQKSNGVSGNDRWLSNQNRFPIKRAVKATSTTGNWQQLAITSYVYGTINPSKFFAVISVVFSAPPLTRKREEQIGRARGRDLDHILCPLLLTSETLLREREMGTENHHEREMERETGEDVTDSMFAKKGCCFWLPCFGSDRSKVGGRGPVWWERIGNPGDNDEQNWRNGNNNADNEKKWWSQGWNAILKVREWSEIVAGPRWKTFIRRFNKKGNRGGGGGGGGGVGWKSGKFQYDPLSYALNFDEGQGQNVQSDEDRLFRDFSSRYASIPISAKSSMDFGKDAPPFT